MKRVAYIFFIGMLGVSLTGCVTVRKVVKERVDQDLSGNLGYMQGSPSEPPAKGAEKREYIDVRLELPTFGEVEKALPKSVTTKRERTKDKKVSGNRGYISMGRGFEEELPPVRRKKPKSVALRKARPKPKPVVSKVKEPRVYKKEAIGTKAAPVGYVKEELFVPVHEKTYKVKTGDTLSKIAKHFYGRASKWTIIYEANAGKIKNPNRIRAGTVLTIPDLRKAESEYLK